MAKATGLKLNLRGLNRLMAGDTAQKIVDDKGNAIARRAGANFEYVQRSHKWTARGYVQPANAEGAREEARDKRLTRALDG